MDISKIMPINELSDLPAKTNKNTNKAAGASFSQILERLQERELQEKIATGTNKASNPAKMGLSKSAKKLPIMNSKLEGDYINSLAIQNPTKADKTRMPQGNAAGSLLAKGKTIDKTSKLYEQALELESYFVKIMINAMKNTLSGDVFGKPSYATKMYRDMVFEELSRTTTKHAGFGLADQIYLELI